MNKVLFVAAIVVWAALVGAVVYSVITTKDRDALNTELTSVKSVLASTQAELASVQAELIDTNDTLDATQAELGDTKGTLTSTLAELNNTQDTLALTESELDTTSQALTSKLVELNTANHQITSMQEDITNLEGSLSNSQGRLTIVEETLDGLGITVAASTECTDVALIDNPAAQNPTWNELISFLTEDRTEWHDYIIDVYDCSQFSRDIHNNAEAAGIRAAEVQVDFKNAATGHALNAFITTDFGLVYIDCTTPPDLVARVKLAKEYRGIETYSIPGKNVRNDYWWDSLMSYYYIGTIAGGNAIVSDIRIYW
jgi:hypothetical protein